MICFSMQSLCFLATTILLVSNWAEAFSSPPCPHSRRTSRVKVEAVDEDKTKNLFFAATENETPKKDTQEKTTPRRKGGDMVKSEFYLDILETIWSAGSEIARDAFFFLRRTAASALTESLPDIERQELLERTMGKQKVTAAQKKADEEYATSMSVQETTAAAVAKEKQRGDPKQWEKEKEEIYKQAEEAAKERVATELAIQRQRMEQERQKFKEEAKEAQEQLKDEMERLKSLRAEIAEEKKELEALQQVKQQGAAVPVQEQESRIAAMEAALQEKEEQAKLDQEKIEQLAQKLEEMESAVEESDAEVDDDDEEEKPRIHAGRYTAQEWRDLTDEEKEEVLALRLESGFAEDEEDNDYDDAASDEHPILGPVVEDLGYKRIHIMSAGKLGTIPIWKKQRIYRHERAKSMVNDKWKSMSLGIPGIICLHEDSETGKLAIIDGQHRVGMMMLLRDKQRRQLQENPDPDFTPIDFDRVLVEVYPSDEDVDKHAQDLFLEINKAEPIKLIDMPGVASAKDRKIISEAVDKLYERYPEMFSPSQRCRVPNVNIDNMRNSLFGSGCLKTHNLTTSKKLYDWIIEQNELVGEKYIESKEQQELVNPKAWTKARENEFYLGLESSWLFS